jgi:CDP-glucose 4,6-dehydratase
VAKREGALEKLAMRSDFWAGKRVFMTGHTGFKGSWLSLMLQSLGSVVRGYALPPATSPSLFEVAAVVDDMQSIEGDIRNPESLIAAVRGFRPEILFHLAAQSLVRPAYLDPVGTYATNVMGTVNTLEAARTVGGIRAIVVVTSDKCYQNDERVWGYLESEPMGGFDPYSSSKGCAELVTAAYRSSFFNPQGYARHATAIASARAGNAIGGGDWATDRLIPDMMTAFMSRRAAVIRSPRAVRPWQHVLECLSGYLILAERLWSDGPHFAESWNFGPADADVQPVEWIADRLTKLWAQGSDWKTDGSQGQPHEATYLKLDCSKARMRLAWAPRLDLSIALEWTVDWYKAYQRGADMRALTCAQIDHYRGLIPA